MTIPLFNGAFKLSKVNCLSCLSDDTVKWWIRLRPGSSNNQVKRRMAGFIFVFVFFTRHFIFFKSKYSKTWPPWLGLLMRKDSEQRSRCVVKIENGSAGVTNVQFARVVTAHVVYKRETRRNLQATNHSSRSRGSCSHSLIISSAGTARVDHVTELTSTRILLPNTRE